MGQVPDLCDPDAFIDSPTQVAAFVRHLCKSETEFHVVTDDATDKPTRMSLRAACVSMGWPTESMREFLNCIGLGKHLNDDIA